MPLPLASSFGTAAILLIFAYGGYEVTGVLAGEAANPRRDVPFAFVATLLIVTDGDDADVARRDRRAAGRGRHRGRRSPMRGHVHGRGRRAMIAWGRSSR